MSSHYSGLVRELNSIYRDIDSRTRIFQIASGARCLPGCGMCCLGRNVEATVLECLPLAGEIFCREEEDSIYLLLEGRTAEDDFRCALFRLDESVYGNGNCSYYRVRPLICRLFGFSARRNKYGDTELCLCGISRERQNTAAKVYTGDPANINPPVYQDSFIRISAISPALGCHLKPINSAIKEALDYVYWKRPKNIHKKRKAA